MSYDQTVMFLYPPELSDEAVAAVSDFLYELVCSFERNYAVQLQRHYDALAQFAREQRSAVIPDHPDTDDPF
jgi:hypothetical protein